MDCCYSFLWQYRSLRALSSSISILFCFSSTATRFSRHLTYSFFFRRHSRAASLEATTEELCEREYCIHCVYRYHFMQVRTAEHRRGKLVKASPNREKWMSGFLVACITQMIPQAWFFHSKHLHETKKAFSTCSTHWNTIFILKHFAVIGYKQRIQAFDLIRSWMDATEEHVRPQVQKELRERPSNTPRWTAMSCYNDFMLLGYRMQC